MSSTVQFAVRHAGLSLKITLDDKWQGRPLTTSVVLPFVKSFNKKRPSYDAIHQDGLAGIQIDGETWVDPSQSAKSSLPADVQALDLHFEAKEAMVASRSCRVACGETELRIELNTKWLRQSFSAAVIAPFAAAYNKKHGNPLVPTPVEAASISSVEIDDAPVPLADVTKPACLVVARGAKRIDLRFGSGATPGATASALSGGGASAGAGSGASLLSERERLQQLWTRVRMTADSLAAAREVKWSSCRFGPAEGGTIGRALLAGASVRCEGAYGDGLGNLLTLNLESNDLRDEGLTALCSSGALDGEAVMVSLRELYLQNNRIGDKGVAALASSRLPTALKVCQLQDNVIGDEGACELARAIRAKLVAFRPRHLNVRENRFDPGGAAADALRAAVSEHYVELKIEPKPSAANVLPSVKAQMRAVDIS